jgi:general secretion pathway protein A
MAGLALVGQPIVVLIDHFDLVEFGCSQALRRLMHLADVTRADLTVLIAARERFTAPLLLDAVELSVELTPWSRLETAQFITDATRESGVKTLLFSDDAIEAIQNVTHGVPAEVVWLCDLCLLAAMSRDVHHVDSELVESAASELSPRDWLLADRKAMAARM